jgi:hypothetical protein
MLLEVRLPVEILVFVVEFDVIAMAVVAVVEGRKCLGLEHLDFDYMVVEFLVLVQPFCKL